MGRWSGDVSSAGEEWSKASDFQMGCGDAHDSSVGGNTVSTQEPWAFVQVRSTLPLPERLGPQQAARLQGTRKQVLQRSATPCQGPILGVSQ